MKGFTLAELVMVVLIVGALVLAVFPIARGLIPPAHLASSARHLSAVIMKLHGESVFTGKTHALRINIETGNYMGLVEEEPGEFAPAGETGGRLLTGVRFVDVVLSGEKIREGSPEIVFLPSGMVSRAVIHMENEENEQISLVLEEAVGRARIVEGYFEEDRR